MTLEVISCQGFHLRPAGMADVAPHLAPFHARPRFSSLDWTDRTRSQAPPQKREDISVTG